MMTTMNLYQNESFATLYRNVSSDQGMMQVMCQMQTKYGIHEHKALANADEMVHLVVMRQNFNNLLSEDAEGVLEEFLKASHRMGGYERKVLLHQLHAKSIHAGVAAGGKICADNVALLNIVHNSLLLQIH